MIKRLVLVLVLCLVALQAGMALFNSTPANASESSDQAKMMGKISMQHNFLFAAKYINENCNVLKGDDKEELEFYAFYVDTLLLNVLKFPEQVLLSNKLSTKRVADSDEYKACERETIEFLEGSRENAKKLLKAIGGTSLYVPGVMNKTKLVDGFLSARHTLQLNRKCNSLTRGRVQKIEKILEKITQRLRADYPDNLKKVINFTQSKSGNVDKIPCDIAASKGFRLSIDKLIELEKWLLDE